MFLNISVMMDCFWSVMRNIIKLWILCSILSKAATTDGQSPDFVAPVNPCRETVDSLCSVRCKVMTVTVKQNGILKPCDFCFCSNPVYAIAWQPETTSALPTTSSTTTHAPGHYFVNGIHYIELRNACHLTEAMCPVTCRMFNVSNTDGHICEVCDCPNDEAILGGNSFIGRRRNVPLSDAESVIPLHKRCLPMFACPIFKCPFGQQLAQGPSGCHFCRCVPSANAATTTSKQPQVTSTTTASFEPGMASTIEPFENFIQMYCMPDPKYCPLYCPVTTYQVDSWTCLRCTCNAGQRFVALQNPCNIHSNVCPSNCTVRHLQDSRNTAITCDFCDCQTEQDNNTNIDGNANIINIGFKMIKNPRKKRLLLDEFSPVRQFQDFLHYLHGPHNNGPTNPYLELGQKSTFAPSDTKKTTMIPQTATPFSAAHKEYVNICLDSGDGCPDVCNLTFVPIATPCYICKCGKHYLYKNEAALFRTPTVLPTLLKTLAPTTRTVQLTTTTSITTKPSRIVSTTTSTPATTTSTPPVTTSLPPPDTSMPTTTGSIPPTTTSLPPPDTSMPTTTGSIPPTTTSLPPPDTSMPTTTRSTPSVSRLTASSTPAATTSTTATTTAPPEVITTPVPSVAKVETKSSTQCYVCDNVTCDKKDLQDCPVGLQYCLSTVIQHTDGTRSFTRKCINESDCYNRWWIKSAATPECLSLTNVAQGRAGKSIVCDFCCKGSACNSKGRIDDFDVYTGEDHVK